MTSEYSSTWWLRQKENIKDINSLDCQLSCSRSTLGSVCRASNAYKMIWGLALLMKNQLTLQCFRSNSTLPSFVGSLDLTSLLDSLWLRLTLHCFTSLWPTALISRSWFCGLYIAVAGWACPLYAPTSSTPLARALVAPLQSVCLWRQVALAMHWQKQDDTL